MGDIGQYFLELDEFKKVKKEERESRTLAWLRANALDFVQGADHLVTINACGCKIDLWTTTHAWFNRSTHIRGRGLGGLFQQLKDCNTKLKEPY